MQNVSSSNSQAVNAPQLRFPSFTKEWHKCELSSIFKKSSIKNKDGKITNVISNSAKNGLIPQTDYFDKEIANSENTAGYYIINKGDFVYNPRKSTEAPFGPISVYDYENTGIVSPLYLCFKPQHEISTTFFKWMFKSPVWHRYIYMSGDSGARHDRVSMRDEVFFSMPLSIPEEAEQIKIADFLSHIEKRIEKQQVLVDNLKLYKRGVLNRVFKENDDWHTAKIRECLDYEQPQKYIVTSEKYDESFQIPVLTANKAFILGYTNETEGIYDKGEVIIYDDFTMDTKFVNFNFKVKSSTIKMLTPKENIDLYFMFNYFQFLSLKPEGHQRSYISLVEPMEVLIPTYEKQVYYSSLFRKLDMKLQNAETVLEKCITLKSGLLQQMFI